MNNMKKPKIRFKGFTDDWEQRKLGDIADVTKLAGFEFTEHVVYSDEGSIIALRGLNIKNGQLVLDDVKYIDGSNFAKLNRSKLFIDDIMFTYVGTVGEVAIIKENDRFYLAPNVSRIRVQSNDSPKFISHYMRTDSFYRHVIFPLIATSSQPALSMENIRKFEICLPKNRDEQDKLSEFFDGIDNLITLHQRKYEKLQIIKKSMLENCFPKNGEKVPKIRFSGFTGDWEQRKLSEVVTEIKRTDEKSDAPVMMITAENGFINQSERYSTNNAGQSLKKYILLEKGELAYNHGASKLRPYGSCFALTTEEKARIPFVYHCFSTETENSEFLSIVLNGKAVEKQLRRIVSSGARMDGLLNISFDEYTSIPVMLPRKDEQDRIAEYFKNLDHLITLHQSELEKLQKIKKSLLERMFV